MIIASEAVVLADRKGKDYPELHQLDEIELMIKVNAGEGRRVLHVNALSSANINYLKSIGYKVESENLNHKISW